MEGVHVRFLSKTDVALVFQVLNQLANFLAYSQRKDQVEPVADTLKDLQAQLRAMRNENKDLGEVELTDDQAAAVALLVPEIIRSLGDYEFSLRTGYEPEQATAVRDRLA